MPSKLEIENSGETGTLGEQEPLQTDLAAQTTPDMKHSETLVDNSPGVRS